MTFQQMYIVTGIIAMIIFFILVSHTSPLGALMMFFLFGISGLSMLMQKYADYDKTDEN